MKVGKNIEKKPRLTLMPTVGVPPPLVIPAQLHVASATEGRRRKRSKTVISPEKSDDISPRRRIPRIGS